MGKYNVIKSFCFCFVVASLLLSGCATPDFSVTLKDNDPSKGVVVGTIFERSVFTPYGAIFKLQGPDGKIILLDRNPRYFKNENVTFEHKPPKVPMGVGRTFAIQLSPGRYKITSWGLDYGSRYKLSGEPQNPIEFDVVANEAIYIGRLDANRFLELASIHDNFNDDKKYFSELQNLRGFDLINKSLSVNGWWLPDATGKEMLKKHGKENVCEQC